LGIGDWGLGIGDWAQSPIPNPQLKILNFGVGGLGVGAWGYGALPQTPNPQSPIKN